MATFRDGGDTPDMRSFGGVSALLIASDHEAETLLRYASLALHRAPIH